MKSTNIKVRRTIVTLALGALVAGAALAPAVAGAAQPKAGVYAGKATQSGSMPYTGTVRLSVAKAAGSYKLAKVTARVKLDCQGDPAQIRRITVAIPRQSGKVSAAGRFSYSISPTSTSGFTIKGRFLTRTKASGTLFLGETRAATCPEAPSGAPPCASPPPAAPRLPATMQMNSATSTAPGTGPSQSRSLTYP